MGRPLAVQALLDTHALVRFFGSDGSIPTAPRV